MMKISQNAVLRVTKNTVALSAARVSVPLISFLFVVYAARFLGATGFGEYVIVRTYLDLFLGLCITGLKTVVTREMARRPALAHRHLSASITLVSLLTLVAIGILVVLVRVLGYTSETRSAVLVACLALGPATLNAMFEAAFVAFERAEYVTSVTVSEHTLRVLVSIAALHRGYGLLTLFVISAVTRTLKLLFYVFLLNRQLFKFRWVFDRGFLGGLVRDWTVFAMEGWLSNIFYRVDVLLLSLFHGELAVGLYGAASKILNPVSVLAYSFTSAVFPHLSRLFEESAVTFKRLTRRVLTYMLVLALLGTLVASLLADRLIVWIYTDTYSASIAVLRVLVWAIIPLTLKPFLSHMLFARREQGKSLQVAAISLCFYVAIGLWLISRWGALGTAWAFLLAESAACGLYLMFVLNGQGAIATVSVFGRTILAALGAGVFLLLFRDAHLVLLLGLGVLFYVFLLLILRVPSSQDIQLMRGVARTGLRWVGSVCSVPRSKGER
jgi:O-antigen/teichoic acid export membrane protein